MIDFSEDTKTLPTKEMKEAMISAKLGDDIMDSDPTTAILESKAATLFGKEAGLFFVSPEMANIAATFVYCSKGDEMIIRKNSRFYTNFGASIAVVVGAQFNIIDEWEQEKIVKAIRPHSEYVESLHKPFTKLISSQISWEDSCKI